MSDKLGSYYYGFDATGVPAIDKILEAVARAGHAFHHTESWTDDTWEPQGLRGKKPVEWIQNAANDAAAILSSHSTPASTDRT